MSEVIPIRKPVDQEAFEELLETIEPECYEFQWDVFACGGAGEPHSIGPQLRLIK